MLKIKKIYLMKMVFQKIKMNLVKLSYKEGKIKVINVIKNVYWVMNIVDFIRNIFNKLEGWIFRYLQGARKQKFTCCRSASRLARAR